MIDLFLLLLLLILGAIGGFCIGLILSFTLLFYIRRLRRK